MPPLSYLERLMVRLGQGAELLGAADLAGMAGYFKTAQRDDGGFAGREGSSDLYYTAFGLRGLALTGELTGEPAQRAARFVRGRLAGEAPIVDFVSLLYAAGLLASAAGIDVLSGSASGWRGKVAGVLETYRRGDGGYAKTAEGTSSSTYQTFLVVIALELIGEPIQQPGRLVDFVRSRRREDGGFVEIGPMRASGTNPTAAAAALLGILDAMDAATRDSIADFIGGMQTAEGGLKANTRIGLADVLSTFTGAVTLDGCGELHRINLAAAEKYVRGLALPEGGFRGGEWDSGSDVEYSFYGLGSLALLAAGRTKS